MLNIQLHGDQQLVQKFESAGPRARAELERAITKLCLILEGNIKNEKLSGQVLHVRTGNLRASIHTVPVESSGDVITGRVASSGDVKYGAIHEFGGKTPAHLIYPKNAQALAFEGSRPNASFVGPGNVVFAKYVNHPGSTMPERSYMRSALGDMKEQIRRELQVAIKKSVA